MENAAVERRLAAVLAMDVVSYSRLMGVDEVGTLTALKSHRTALIDPVVAAHHGRLVKTTGDGLLLEFASVVDAIGCAVAIQRGMLTRNAEVPENKRLVFRVGINIGDIIIDGGDIFGDGVNVAARLETLCEPGGICISRAANEQVRDKLSLSFADLGDHMVKNIARAVGVYGLAAKDIASMPEIPMHRSPAESVASLRRPRSRIFIAAAVAATILVGAAAWWLGGNRFALSPQGLEPQLTAALAKSLPKTTTKFREEIATAFFQSTAHRALAVARQAARLRWTAGWPTRELAEEKALEKCQQVYDEPCALIAVDDVILASGPDGIWPVRDAPRVRYAGPFSVERIPAMRAKDLQRPAIAGYLGAPAPKAMAFYADGVIEAVSGAASQRVAEEQALRACNNDPVRRKGGDACYLYAIGDRVVLPLRATAPIAAATVASPASAAPAPSTAPVATGQTVRARLLDSLAKIVPSQQASTRETQVTGYQSSASHRAIAAFPPSSSWRTAGWASAALAEERALEGCQVRYGGPCVLVAVDDVIQPVDGNALRRPMPRADYGGPFDPKQIPAAGEALRQRPDVVDYSAAKDPKAAAFHPRGRLFVATGAASQRAAEEQVLSECNADSQRNGQTGSCLLYAVGNQVVLPKRATAPTAAP
jgi:class 3 adenylate cyclase